MQQATVPMQTLPLQCLRKLFPRESMAIFLGLLQVFQEMHRVLKPGGEGFEFRP